MHDLTATSKLILGAVAAVGAAITGGTMYAVRAPAETITRAEAETIATAKAETAAESARTDCRRELAAQTASVQASLARIESAVSKLSESTEQLKVDVATLKARSVR